MNLNSFAVRYIDLLTTYKRLSRSVKTEKDQEKLRMYEREKNTAYNIFINKVVQASPEEVMALRYFLMTKIDQLYNEIKEFSDYRKKTFKEAMQENRWDLEKIDYCDQYFEDLIFTVERYENICYGINGKVFDSNINCTRRK